MTTVSADEPAEDNAGVTAAVGAIYGGSLEATKLVVSYAKN